MTADPSVSPPTPTELADAAAAIARYNARPRTVAWFSAGAASAVAAKLCPDAIVAYVDPGSEHPDNARFVDDVAAWIGRPITVLRSDRYADTWAVWEDVRFLNSPHGAACTGILKRAQRHAFTRAGDRQVFGYTADEEHRADRFREQNPDVDLSCPLIDRGLTKTDCLAIVDRAGLELPVLYRLGYAHNNCLGCVKGGAQYWNAIRRDFPAVFARMAALERDLGHALLTDRTGGERRPLYLDELAVTAVDAEPVDMDCSLLCAITEAEIDDG